MEHVHKEDNGDSPGGHETPNPTRVEDPCNKRHTEQVENEWVADVLAKPKLRTYKTVKTKLKTESYLSLEDRSIRREMFYLRSGSNRLRIETGRWEKIEAIETGRWEKIEAKDRSCFFCKKMEDEKHFLADCGLYRFIRQDLRDKLGKECPVGADDFAKWILRGDWSRVESERGSV